MKKSRKYVLIALAAGLLITPSLRAAIRGPLVVSDRWPETTNLMTWAGDIWRLDGVTGGTDRQKAVSLFHWLRLFNRLNCEARGGMTHAFEGPYGEEVNARDLHKHLFVYGWGFCDTHSIIAEGVWNEYKGTEDAADRVICQHESGGYHTMYRLMIDGKPGAFDARYGYYLIEKDSPDARILDWDGVGRDENIYANLHYENRCRPFFEFPQHEFDRALWLKPKPVFKSEAAWREAGAEPEVVFLNPRYKLGTEYHDMSFRLPRGTTVERHWDNSMKKWFIPGNERISNQFLPEGRFYRVGANMVGADGEKNDPNFKYMKPYLTRVPGGMGYPEYIEGDLSLGQAWGRITYAPDLAAGHIEDAVSGGSGLTCADHAPYVRPAGPGGGEWVLDFYCPYVMVEGYVTGVLTGDSDDNVEVALRSMVAKPNNLSDPDSWLEWKVIADSPGHFQVRLDRGDAAEGESSLHGVYRWQLRIRLADNGGNEQAGLSALRMLGYFENGIMSIPQIFAGENTVRLKLDKNSSVEAPVRVRYEWTNSDGTPGCHEKTLVGEQFYMNNEAVWHISAPELERCNSVTVQY